MSVHFCILAGGSGARVVPFLGEGKPKQFCVMPKLGGTMLSRTYSRLCMSKIVDSFPCISINVRHQDFLKEEFSLQDFSQVFLEEESKNTAFAITAMAMRIYDGDREGSCIFFPSDHHFGNDKELMNFIDDLILSGCNEPMVILVVPAKSINRNYGNVVLDFNMEGKFLIKVKQFIEKPKNADNLDKVFWNTGIFFCKVEEYLRELNLLDPPFYHHCKLVIDNAKEDLNCCWLPTGTTRIQNLSIEKLFTERSNNLYARVLETEWRDLGSISNLKACL